MEGTIQYAAGPDGVVTITLDHPEHHNALTMAMQAALDEALARADLEGARCVVLTGAGDRAFSAGYDLAEMAGWSSDALLLALLERERWLWRLASCPVPIIAAINGLAYGWGAIAVSAADLRVASPQAVISFSSARMNGAQATWTLPRLVGQGRAAELLMTARRVDAAEAERIGLVNRVAPDHDALAAVAQESAELIAANPPTAIRAIKRLLREHAGRGIEDRFITENLVTRTELRPQAAPPIPVKQPVNDR